MLDVKKNQNFQIPHLSKTMKNGVVNNLSVVLLSSQNFNV